MRWCRSSGENLHDLCDADLFSKHKHAIQIQLFYDDFETANPLVSKQGIHKLGEIFYLAEFLPSTTQICLIFIWSLYFMPKMLKCVAFLKYLIHLCRILKYLRRMEFGSPCMISQCMELLPKLQVTTLVFTVFLVLLNHSVPDIVADSVLLRKKTFRLSLMKIHPR